LAAQSANGVTVIICQAGQPQWPPNATHRTSQQTKP
jgi:hypothetical protein